MSRNEPRNACNASNFTPTDSRPDSMFDCARGLRSNYARFSRVRSAKELTFSTFTILFVICFRPTIAFRDYKFPPTLLIALVQRDIILLRSIRASSFLPSFLFKVENEKKNYSILEISSNVSSDNEPATLFERCSSQHRG